MKKHFKTPALILFFCVLSFIGGSYCNIEWYSPVKVSLRLGGLEYPQQVSEFDAPVDVMGDFVAVNKLGE
jgi:hypothetical protein